MKRGGIPEEQQEPAAKRGKTLLCTAAGVKVTCKERKKTLPASFLGGPASCKGFLRLKIPHRVFPHKFFLLCFSWESFGGHFPFFWGGAFPFFPLQVVERCDFREAAPAGTGDAAEKKLGPWGGGTNLRPTAARLLFWGMGVMPPRCWCHPRLSPVPSRRRM